jgi:hypothetical protein
LALQHSTFVRSRFRLLHIIQLLVYPGGRFSVDIIHVVSSPISFFHLSTLSFLGFLVIHLVLFIKLFLDLSRYLPSCSPCIMCCSSFVTFVRSQSAYTDRRISGGALPDRVYSLFTGVFFRHPMMSRHVSFRAVSIFFVCADLSHTWLAKSPVEKQSAKVVTLNACGSVPHADPTSLHNNPFLILIFIFVFSQCTLYVSDLSKTTPRY